MPKFYSKDSEENLVGIGIPHEFRNNELIEAAVCRVEELGLVDASLELNIKMSLLDKMYKLKHPNDLVPYWWTGKSGKNYPYPMGLDLDEYKLMSQAFIKSVFPSSTLAGIKRRRFEDIK